MDCCYNIVPILFSMDFFFGTREPGVRASEGSQKLCGHVLASGFGWDMNEMDLMMGIFRRVLVYPSLLLSERDVQFFSVFNTCTLDETRNL
jgi:hypothetical protein